jgi:hypothetical protein
LRTGRGATSTGIWGISAKVISSRVKAGNMKQTLFVVVALGFVLVVVALVGDLAAVPRLVP